MKKLTAIILTAGLFLSTCATAMAGTTYVFSMNEANRGGTLLMHINPNNFTFEIKADAGAHSSEIDGKINFVANNIGLFESENCFIALHLHEDGVSVLQDGGCGAVGAVSFDGFYKSVRKQTTNK